VREYFFRRSGGISPQRDGRIATAVGGDALLITETLQGHAEALKVEGECSQVLQLGQTHHQDHLNPIDEETHGSERKSDDRSEFEVILRQVFETWDLYS